MLFWALLASGKINMRKVDGWQTLATTTVAETLPGFVAVGWQCVVAPVGTPQAIVHKISNDLRAVLVNPGIKDKLAARGGYVHPASPTEAEAFVRSQQELWKPALEQVALQFQQK